MRTDDVQYGPDIASVYDSLIAPAAPTDSDVELLREAVTGKDVLEVGVGTGRMAVPLAPISRSFTGLDNSPHMLDVLRTKDIRGEVDFVQGDFREPYATDKRFHTAFSAMGSLACVGSRAELVTALSHIADRLRPGGALWLEYYAREVYLRLMETAEHFVTDLEGRKIELRFAVDEATDLLAMDTVVHGASGEWVTFSESVLLLAPAEVEQCLVDAGFSSVRFINGRGQAYDWYVSEIG
ncbi:class I SAM-dependent DNA methyltransferase [Streptomyces sp. NPDC055036]